MGMLAINIIYSLYAIHYLNSGVRTCLSTPMEHVVLLCHVRHTRSHIGSTSQMLYSFDCLVLRGRILIDLTTLPRAHDGTNHKRMYVQPSIKGTAYLFVYTFKKVTGWCVRSFVRRASVRPC